MGRLHWGSGSVLACVLFLTACGGDDGGSAPPPPASQALTITGTAVSSNSGSLAKAMPRQGLFQWLASLFVTDGYAQASGIGPVQNARVVVFRINNDGTVQTSPSNQTGILKETTTNGVGFYQVTLPDSVNPASDLIVQVSNAAAGTAPSPIGAPNVLNAPAAQAVARTDQTLGRVINVNVSPGTEVATREIVAKVQSTGGTLANFTNQETTAFVGLMANASHSLGAGTLPLTLVDIKTQLQPVITETMNQLAPPGTATQSTVTGTYAFAMFFAGLDIANSRTGRYMDGGLVTFDGTTGTFSSTYDERGQFLAETCGAVGNLCQRSFVTSLTLNSTETETGSFMYLPSTGQLVLADASGTTIVGSINADGTVALLPLADARQGITMGFGLAIKAGSGLTVADLVGTYTFAQLGSEVSQAGSFPGTWPAPILSYTGSGTVTFAAPNVVNVGGSVSTMTQMVNCTVGGTQGCTISGTLGTETLPTTVNGTFTVTSNGVFTIVDPASPGETIRGLLAADKKLALIPLLDFSGGAMAVSIRQGTGLTASSLNGTYGLLIFRDLLDTVGHMRTVLHSGTVTFNGAGGHSVATKEHFASLASDCIGGACGYHVGSNIPGGLTDFSATGTYSVTQATNAVTFTVPGLGTFTGTALPNGAGTDVSFLYATESFDSQNRPGPGGGQHSGRAIALLVKR
ncbi:MAG: hypothetical protein U0236_04910 [Nitrospira sp.]